MIIIRFRDVIFDLKIPNNFPQTDVRMACSHPSDGTGVHPTTVLKATWKLIPSVAPVIFCPVLHLNKVIR